MVFVVNEQSASKIFESYKNVAAFTLGKGKSYTNAEAKIQVSYKKLSFLPSDDTINAVLSGDIKAKKVIASACKAVQKIKMDDEGSAISLSMIQLISMLQQKPIASEAMSKKEQKKYMKKFGPNVLVFVLDGENPDRDKFLTKYIAALFNLYGYDVVTKGKVIKKIFKGKRRKIYSRIRTMSDSKGFRLSNEGRVLYRLGQMYYKTELLQISLSEVTAVGKISEKMTTHLAEHLINQMSTLNILDAVKLPVGQKKKLAKMFKKKDRAVFEAYDELCKILATMDIKIPAAKFGANKKEQTPKMKGKKVKKFVKFYGKKNNRDLLRLVYAHIVCSLMDVAVGSSDYNKSVSDILSEVYGSDFSKAYVTAAKAYAKSTPAV